MSSPLRSPLRTRNDLAAALAAVLEREYGVASPQVEVGRSRNPDFGDLSCNSAMPLAKELRMNPRDIAGTMAEGVRDSFPEIDRVTVDGPGFLNFTLSSEYLHHTVFSIAGNGLAPMIPAAGSGQKAMVEFVSSNPTGPLTVGHCRQAVLGDAVSGLLEVTGWEVHREYYFNDAGKQMDRLAGSLAARYLQLLGKEMELPEGGYCGDYVREWARNLIEDAGNGLRWPADARVFREYGAEKAFLLIRSDLELLGIGFDRFFAESELIPDAVNKAIGMLSEKGLVEADGDQPRKLRLKLTELGRPEDRVIVREDGTFTYRMPDIAYHLNKFARDCRLIVDVFGSDHIDTCRDVEAALMAILGREEVEARLRTVIHQFVTLMRGGEKVKMSTRSGNFVTLRDLVEEVGSADVVRYIFLTRKSESHMEFDLAAASSDTEENPVFYVQYAFARISGILRNLEELPDAPKNPYLLSRDRERHLMRLLETVPLRVEAAAEALEPHRITELLGEIATAFHGFYQHHRVIDADPGLTWARINLCLAVRNVLTDLLGILGVKAPEKM